MGMLYEELQEIRAQSFYERVNNSLPSFYSRKCRWIHS